MKIKNTEDVLQYPESYDFLTEEQQNKIHHYMNAVQDLAQRYYNKHIEAENKKDHDKYLLLYNQTMAELTGSKSAYATINVYVEYNWPQHHHEWILATRKDAQAYLDAADDPYPAVCPVEDEENSQNVLLSYKDM